MYPIKIIHEDNHLIAVDKEPGILVHGDNTGDITLLDMAKQYIKVRYNKPGEVFLVPVHRIDRPTSGIVLFARTSKSLSRMNQLLKDRKVMKSYFALVERRPPEFEGRLEHYIIKDGTKNKVKVSFKKRTGGKQALLNYKFLEEVSHYIKLKVDLITGRSHQIRAQLGHINCPIVGDLKYGFTRPNEDKSICLHSAELSFIHPVSKELVKIESDLPEKGYWSLFN